MDHYLITFQLSSLNYTSVSMEGTNTTETYILMALLSFLSVMGTAGNLLVLYVFSQKRDKLVSTLFILALAFVDFLTSAIIMPYTIYVEYVDFRTPFDFICKGYQFLITSNIPFSALIMVAIAIDRYFCICHPFLHAINMTRAKIIIACLAAFSVGLGVVVAMIHSVYQAMPIGMEGNQTTVTMNMNMDVNMTSTLADEYDTIQAITSSYSNHTVEASTEIFDYYFGQKVVLTKECRIDYIILSETFMWYYQKFYTAMYLVCLIIVIVLYTLIYRSVLSRRTKRQKQKSKSIVMVSTKTENEMNGNSQEETLLTTVNGESQPTDGAPKQLKVQTVDGEPETVAVPPPANKKQTKKEKKNSQRKSTKKDKTKVANLKTAVMLFVVTVVFIVTFLPAFLMALMLIPMNRVVFYMYFANNVANPVIYSFMNKNFRDDLAKLFCGKR